jgi:hypothetical protein
MEDSGRINKLINIINHSNQLIRSIKAEDSVDLKRKSKGVYDDFKQIIKNLSQFEKNMKPQMEIMQQTISNISRLSDEYERIKIYQLGLNDLGMSLNNPNFKLDQSLLTLPISVPTQSGGAGNGSSEFNELTQRLTDKLNTMNRLSKQVNGIIDKIMLVIGDTVSSDGLMNIRIKIEWIIQNIAKFSDDSDASKKMGEQIKDLLSLVDQNISNQSANKEKLDKIKNDIMSYTKDVGLILNRAPNAIQMTNAVSNNAISQPIQQMGGFSNTISESDSLNNSYSLNQFNQTGGAEFDRYFDIRDIDTWLVFFKNIKSWSDDNRLLFCSIRAYYYMVRRAAKMVADRCRSSDYLQNMFYQSVCCIL